MMAMMEINFRPTTRQLRQFGAAGLVAFGALGAWAFWRHGLFGIQMAETTARGLATGLWIAAAACGALALVAPSLLRPLHVLLMLITWPIGLVISHLVMVILFYGVFTPIALIFRLMGRDSMERRFDRAATTYWVPRQPVTDMRRYFRQF